MTRVLRHYFPELKERDEILRIIQESERLKTVFYGWEKVSQEEFLDFCSGSKGGVPISRRTKCMLFIGFTFTTI